MKNCLIKEIYEDDIIVSNKYDLDFMMFSKNIIDWRLPKAITYVESNFDKNAYSSAGACGLMQITKIACQEVSCNWSNIFDVKENINTGCDYLIYLKSRKLDRFQIVCAYNGGVTRVVNLINKYKSNFYKYLPIETKNYVVKVGRVYNLLTGNNL